MRPPTTRNELRDNKASGLAVAAAGTENKTSGEEKKIIIPLPHGACTERDTRTGCNVFDLHSRTHTHTPTPASHTCVYLDAPLIVIRSINYNLTKNYSKKIAPSYLLGQVHVVLFSCNGFAINLRFFFGGGELKLTNEYI